MKILSISILGIWKLWPRRNVELEDSLRRLQNVVERDSRGGAGHPHFRPPSARPSSISHTQRGAWL